MKTQIYISERLENVFEEAMRKTLTLVEAPTGYGKTRAIRRYLVKHEIPIRWVNIYDNNPYHAWERICHEIFSNATVIQRFIKWPFPAAGMQRDSFSDAFSDVLEENEEEFVLVIDDYHEIASSQANDFFMYLSREFEGQFHVVLTAKKKVFEDESEYIHTGKISFVGVDDLRFTKEDFEEYIKLLGYEDDLNLLEPVYEKSEGWISMIHVALLSYKRTGKFDVTMDMTHLVNRVAYENMSKQAQYLLSYFPYKQNFTKEQADFYSKVDTQKLLDDLVDKQLFFSYDRVGEKYHIHPILSDCIRYRFEKMSLAERCRRFERIAEHCVTLKNYNAAMRWYQKAGNFEVMLQTMELFETMCSVAEERDVFILCFDTCPETLFEDYPFSLILFMWRFLNYGETERLEKCKTLFENVMRQSIFTKLDSDYLWKAYYIFLSQSCFNDLDKMREYALKAFAYEGTDFPRLDFNVPRSYGIPSMHHIFYIDEKEGGLAKKLEEHLNLYAMNGIKLYGGLVDLVKAETAYYEGDFDTCEKYCDLAIKSFEKTGMVCYIVNAKYMLCKLAWVHGNRDEVNKLTVEMRDMVLRERSETSPLAYTLDMCEVYTSANVGFPKITASWVDDIGIIPQEVMPQAKGFALIIQLSKALHDGRFDEVLDNEDAIMPFIEEYNNQFSIAQVNLIFASAYAARGQIYEAIEYIKKSMAIVSLKKNIFYATYGLWILPALVEMSKTTKKYNELITLVKKLNSFRKNIAVNKSHEIFPILSKRENEIALLVLDGFTNKQIAEQLYISENTVKSALKNIFSKLNINSRRDLVKVAQMGIQH